MSWGITWLLLVQMLLLIQTWFSSWCWSQQEGEKQMREKKGTKKAEAHQPYFTTR